MSNNLLRNDDKNSERTLRMLDISEVLLLFNPFSRAYAYADR